MIAAGQHLEEPATLERGIGMLAWLLDLQVRDGHVSPIGNEGWSPGERLPSFDQQPIEVAHLVDACIAAYEATQDEQWLEYARLCGLWFYGVNDGEVWMHEPRTGGGYDGLTPEGRNGNCGAESTLAYLATLGQLEAYQAQLRDLSQAAAS